MHFARHPYIRGMLTIGLLIASNLFMTFAWYWHLKGQGPAWSLWTIVLTSWLIALPEYCLAVPANRFGSLAHGGPFTPAQLKVIQEGVSIAIFLAFLMLYLKQWPTWRELAGLGLVLSGVALAISDKRW
jgi:uncharacterized protein (DUF486 family)